MNDVKGERAQATVVAVIAMTVLLGLTAAVLDVGSWYRADRAAQSTADAAALAGAQALPYNPAGATALAQQYAAKNGGGLGGGEEGEESGISFSQKLVANDTITVKVKRSAPGFFSKIFGIKSVTVGAKASARASNVSAAKWAAPITVRNTHPKLADLGCPCFGEATSLPLDKTGAPGAFALVTFDSDVQGTTGTPILADWINHGLDRYLNLGAYLSDPGAKWNSSQIRSTLSARIGSELLFPVYDTLTGTGSNAQYHVIGWVGFHLTGVTANGNSGSISGWFTQVIWEGLQVESSSQTPSFGARAIELVD